MLLKTCLQRGFEFLKGELLGLGQFLATKSLLKMMKNDFYFTLKALFVLKILNFFHLVFWSCKKRLHSKDKVNFIFYDTSTSETNIWDTHVAQYLKK